MQSEPHDVHQILKTQLTGGRAHMETVFYSTNKAASILYVPRNVVYGCGCRTPGGQGEMGASLWRITYLGNVINKTEPTTITC